MRKRKQRNEKTSPAPAAAAEKMIPFTDVSENDCDGGSGW